MNICSLSYERQKKKNYKKVERQVVQDVWLIRTKYELDLRV